MVGDSVFRFAPPAGRPRFYSAGTEQSVECASCKTPLQNPYPYPTSLLCSIECAKKAHERILRATAGARGRNRELARRGLADSPDWRANLERLTRLSGAEDGLWWLMMACQRLAPLELVRDN